MSRTPDGADTADMRQVLTAALWIYLAWYATSLAAEFLPVPGFSGAVVALVLVASRSLLLARSGSKPGLRPVAESRP